VTKHELDQDGWIREAQNLLERADALHRPRAADRERVRSALAARLLAQAAGADRAALGERAMRPVRRGVATAARAKLAYWGGVALLFGAGALVAPWRTAPPTPLARTPAAADLRASTPAKESGATPPADTTKAEASPPLAPRLVPAQPRARTAAHGRSVVNPAALPRMVAPETTRSALGLEVSTPLAASASAPVQLAPHDMHPERTQPPAARPSTAGRPPGSAAVAPAMPSTRAELGCIERMQEALRAGDLGRALALSAEHQRTWPRGAFTQEREGVRAIAQCQSGTLGARAQARAFLARYPSSLLAGRVRAACP
jgi:hypothetical protein